MLKVAGSMWQLTIQNISMKKYIAKSIVLAVARTRRDEGGEEVQVIVDA